MQKRFLSSHGSYLGFLKGPILVIFDIPSLKSVGSFVSEKRSAK